ncbi:TPA: conjugal transfer protein TrbF [Campylobacter fetus subsp. venerealis]|nr:conjugal transfer protein TrbF [Campylobacter fetus subsp. venerealis]HDX8126101.1 conjugal transfer protein TrbF [Campylobacter fetus subsp. venerealis]HDX8133961.1 conjugal transfer protein TrbF [Campylobacter fetus subsp. venerealis]HDX8141292.1 conjugal transfer protein TrbF [Campylobacter fetus subsp. venerealis]
MGIFKQKMTNKQESVNNPYLNAKREWLERYGDYISRARNWQIVAILSIIVTIISVFYIGYIGSQNKLIPYVIEVDKLGNTANVGMVRNVDIKNPNVIKYSLNTFIYSWRSIWGNPEIQRKFIFDAYKYIEPGSKAFLFLNDSYAKANPFEQGTKQNVRIKVDSIVLQTSDTWQIQWRETTTNLAEEQISDIVYRGFFKVKQIIPTKEEDILKNPLGIFITDFNFAKIL